MDKMTVHILGCGSASPSTRHNPSAQILDYRGSMYMIDCGEGAQREMMRRGLSLHRVKHIFLSHLHGDHCLGLVPMLSTMALRDKGGTVTIHTFAEGERILRAMIGFFCGEADFDIQFNIVKPGLRQTVLETRGMTVEAFPLYHRVPCVGYLFRERIKPRHLRADMLDFYNVPVSKRKEIAAGTDFVTSDGRIISNERLTTPPSPSLSYAYCSDTIASAAVVDDVRGVDLLYHEATYTDERAAYAVPRGHSTAREAAQIARLAGVGELMIGHYSKTTDMKVALAEAREVFPDTIAADEGMSVEIKPKRQ